jgi:membrane protein YqaA with SNARE-associated domain
MNTPHLETHPETAAQKARATRNPIRKLYFWTLHWGTTRWAVPALVVLSFTESSFFPIPPDVLLIALCFATPTRWFALAAMCTVASVLGGAFGYFIGATLWESVGQQIVAFYHGEAVMQKVRHWYDTYGFVGVLVAAITPIPYKVFTIASGVFQFDFWQFMGASFLGRGFRFFVVAGMIGMLGERVRPFIEERLEVLLIALTVLGVGGFVLLKYLH